MSLLKLWIDRQATVEELQKKIDDNKSQLEGNEMMIRLLNKQASLSQPVTFFVTFHLPLHKSNSSDDSNKIGVNASML